MRKTVLWVCFARSFWMLLGVSWATADAPLKDKVIWLLLYGHTVSSLLRNSFLYLGVLRGPWEVPRGGSGGDLLEVNFAKSFQGVPGEGPGASGGVLEPLGEVLGWHLRALGSVCAQRGGLRKGA